MENIMEKSKNGFLITWISCVVLLLGICYLGINSSSVKGTLAAETKYTCTCTEGSPTSNGDGTGYCTVKVQLGNYYENTLGWSCELTSGSVALGTQTYTCTKAATCTAESASSSSSSSNISFGACWKCSDGYHTGTYAQYGSFCTQVSTSSCTSSSSSSSSSTDETCDDGYLNEDGECVQSGSSNTITCAPGKYYSGQNICSTCPAGYYCPGGTFTIDHGTAREGVHACDPGTTSVAGSDSKSDCTSTDTTSYCWNAGNSQGNAYIWGTKAQYEGKYNIVDNCYCNDTCGDSSGPSSDPNPPTGGGGGGGVTPTPTPSSDSTPGTSSTPSSSSDVGTGGPISSEDDNVVTNPQTGQIAIFVLWVVTIAAIVYSVWYFKKIKES